MCQSCDVMDNVCCSLRVKTIIFAVWTLVHATALSIIIGIALDDYEVKLAELKGFKIFLITICVVHVLSGLLLVLGVLIKVPWVLITGTILSYAVPILFATFLYIIALQVLFTIWTCRYCTILLAQTRGHAVKASA